MSCRDQLRASLLMFAMVCVASWAWPQQSGQTTGTTSAGSSSSAGSSNTTGSSADPANRQRSLSRTGSQQDRRAPLLTINGIVVLDNGSPPPPGAVIERVCTGQATKEAYVAPDGSFSFQIGGISFVNPDASDSVPPRGFDPPSAPSIMFSAPSLAASPRLTGCDLRAQLPGYRSSVLLLDMSQMSGNVDIGMLVLYPAAKVTGTTVSITSLAAPKKAQKFLAIAEKAILKKDLTKAEKQLDAALTSYPVYSQAWFRLGQIREIQQSNEAARSAFTRALEADGNFVSPLIELARMSALEKNWEETAAFTASALKLNPIDYPYGYFLDALSNYQLNRLDRAEKSARMLERLDTRHRYPENHLLLANVFRRRRDATAESGQLMQYLKYAPRASNAPQVRARLQRLMGS